MPIYKDKDVKRILKSLGYREGPGSRNKHIYYYLYVNGLYTGINTHFSKNNQDIDDHLISQIANQMRINRQDFIKLMNGQIDREEYLRILTIKNEL